MGLFGTLRGRPGMWGCFAGETRKTPPHFSLATRNPKDPTMDDLDRDWANPNFYDPPNFQNALWDPCKFLCLGAFISWGRGKFDYAAFHITKSGAAD